ncbi:MAG: hypothetical protein IPL98_11615 [Saprospiraceae bacterium]|nr:hypothetical protein [Saprospiraceae bacterium]
MGRTWLDIKCWCNHSNVRGLPDDFAGEMIDQHMSIKERSTISYGPSLQLEISGADAASGISAAAGLGLNLEIEEDNYDGIGVKVGVDGSARFGGRNFGGLLGLGMGVNSRGGGYANPRCGLSGSLLTRDQIINWGSMLV